MRKTRGSVALIGVGADIDLALARLSLDVDGRRALRRAFALGIGPLGRMQVIGEMLGIEFDEIVGEVVGVSQRRLLSTTTPRKRRFALADIKARRDIVADHDIVTHVGRIVFVGAKADPGVGASDWCARPCC